VPLQAETAPPLLGKRNPTTNNFSVEHKEPAKLLNSDMTIIKPWKSKHQAEKIATSKKESERVWRPNESRKANCEQASHSQFVKESNGDMKIYFHRHKGYLPYKRLGKVMTLTNLKSLPANEETDVQNTYYIKFTDDLRK
jgi:hypothetical protein